MGRSVRDRIFATMLELSAGRRPPASRAAADPLAGDLGAVPLHRKSGRAGGDRRDAEDGQMLIAGAVRGGGRPRHDGAALYNSVIAIDDAARSLMPSTRFIWCRLANICPLRSCLRLRHRAVGRWADEFRQPAASAIR